MAPFIPNQKADTGYFLPTTTIFDSSQINSLPGESDQLKNLLVIMYQTINQISKATNAKYTGIYTQQEFVNGKTYFNPVTNEINQPQRSNFSMTYLVSVPPGTTPFPHGLPLTSAWAFTGLEGFANDTTDLLYYPFGSGNTGQISIMVNDIDFVITNSTANTFDTTYVTLFYLKN